MVEINRDMLVAKRSEVDELDEQLDSATGGQSAGKRAVTNRLVDSTKDSWADVVNQVSSYLTSITDPDEFAGVFAGVRQNLLNDKEMNARFDSVLETKAEEIKAATPNFTEDQIKEISEARRKAAKEFGSIAELLGLFGVQVSEKDSPDYVEPPKRRTGAHGKRGPRAISGYTWSVGGVRMAPKEDTLAGVAAANEYEKVTELKEAMKAAGIDLKNPPEEVKFTLSNGKELVGVKSVQVSEETDDDDDDDDDDTPETSES